MSLKRAFKLYFQSLQFLVLHLTQRLMFPLGCLLDFLVDTRSLSLFFVPASFTCELAQPATVKAVNMCTPSLVTKVMVFFVLQIACRRWRFLRVNSGVNIYIQTISTVIFFVSISCNCELALLATVKEVEVPEENFSS